MSIQLNLLTCHVGDRALPSVDDDLEDKDEDVEDDEDDEEFSLDDAPSMTEAEKQAVLALLGNTLTSRPDHKMASYRLETPAGPVTVKAIGLDRPGNCFQLTVSLRTLDPEAVALVHRLMVAGYLCLIASFDGGTKPVTVSEEHEAHLRGHLPAATVCASADALLRYLTDGVEERRRIQPDAFEDDWEDRMDDADAARRLMRTDRTAAEEVFRRLLEAAPGDGTLYLFRGQAYEGIGLKDLAAEDYRKAVDLCPDLFQEPARLALARVTG